MSKRKQTDEEDSDEQDLVDVDFDYYNIDADKDYHAIKQLFTQLFGPNVETGPLADLVTRAAEESGVGSTIKMDESDACAVLTVVDCPSSVAERVLSKTDGEFHETLSTQLRDGRVGLVLSERLVNMPAQVMGPMYRMLGEEIETAIAEGRDYRFTHYLFLARAYQATPVGPKRVKTNDGLFPFHAEDREIIAHATQTAAFEEEEDRLVRVMIVSRDRFGSLIESIRGIYGE